MVSRIWSLLGRLFGAIGNRCTVIAGWCAAARQPHVEPEAPATSTVLLDPRDRPVLPPHVAIATCEGTLPPGAAPAPGLRILEETTAFGRSFDTWRPGHENTRTAHHLRLVPKRQS